MPAKATTWDGQQQSLQERGLHTFSVKDQKVNILLFSLACHVGLCHMFFDFLNFVLPPFKNVKKKTRSLLVELKRTGLRATGCQPLPSGATSSNKQPLLRNAESQAPPNTESRRAYREAGAAPGLLYCSCHYADEET